MVPAASAGVLLVAGVALATAAPASAGCETRGTVQYCDMPVRPDGTWDRCRIAFGYGISGVGDSEPTRVRCSAVDPNRLWWVGEPPYHVDP
ncbi:hypothetical protein GCM10023114_53220 [Mycolicibacterium sediminis]|uniref:CDGP domain-containing protein n=1 Tax=Mycolicibacterium sediminis TaxID=1286180 RepID=A0A7I7QKX5_9MYCO|nr:hypothetical protein MSEDJ_10200 [Mycolicibacterium sediminis]